MSEHIVKSYDAELKSIIALLSQMGAISLHMLSSAMDALTRLDGDLARSVVETDPRLDALQREIEDKAVATIARRQPMAVDLRQLVGAIRIAGDLERTGDLAKNIAKRAIVLGADDRVPRLAIGLKHMSDLAARQLNEVLSAFETRDVDLAHAVWARDEALDAMEDSVFRDLLTFMMEDPRNISFCTHLLFCSKNIERIGDHATNIAETVHYIASGASLPINRPKGADPQGLTQAG